MYIYLYTYTVWSFYVLFLNTFSSFNLTQSFSYDIFVLLFSSVLVLKKRSKTVIFLFLYSYLVSARLELSDSLMSSLWALQKALGEPNAFSQQAAVRVKTSSSYSQTTHYQESSEKNTNQKTSRRMCIFLHIILHYYYMRIMNYSLIVRIMPSHVFLNILHVCDLRGRPTPACCRSGSACPVTKTPTRPWSRRTWMLSPPSLPSCWSS